jgi:putative aldouronate transport system substrate-binding protein
MLESNVTADDSRVLPIIEEFTNTELTIQYTESMVDVLPVAMAAGDLTDVVGSWWYRQPYQVSAFRGGVFRDLTDFIGEYQNLSAVPEQVYTNTSLDGRIYGLPRMRAIARPAISYRDDWRETLGLPEPKSVDDVYNLLRAFTFNDPDGNGKNDTFGLSDRTTMNVRRFWSIRFGAPNNWGIRPDGTFYATHETPEYLEALKFIRRMVEEKITYSDFAVTLDQPMKDRLISGQAGAYPRHIDEAYLMQNFMPDARIGIISPLAGPDGVVRTTGESGAGGLHIFTSANFEDDARLRRALKFFDDLGTPEMSNLFQYGIEGVHYNVVDGKAAMIDKGGYARELEHLRNQLVVLHASINSMPGDLPEIMQIGEAMKRSNEQYAVWDPTLALVSPTAAEIGAQLQQMINDAEILFLAGEIDEAEWWDAVEAWKKAGGDELAAEYAQLYKAQQP